MGRSKILFVLLAAVLIAVWTAWHLWPVQIMVIAYRWMHPVAANRPVHWAEGPARPPAGERPPNIVLILADDLGINDITAEGRGTGVAGGLVPTPNIAAIARDGADCTTAPDQLATYVLLYGPQDRPYPTIYHADLQAKTPPMEDMGMPSSEVTI